jgi:hypothetical protein
MEVSGQLHAPAALPPGIAPDTHWIGGCVDPRRNGEEKNSQPRQGIEPLNPDRPTRSLVTILTEMSLLLL